MRRPSLSHCAKRYPMPRRLRRKILDIFVISYLLSWVYSLFKWIKIVEFLLVKDWKFPEQWQRTHPPLKNVQNYSILYKSEAEEWEFLIASLFC